MNGREYLHFFTNLCLTCDYNQVNYADKIDLTDSRWKLPYCWVNCTKHQKRIKYTDCKYYVQAIDYYHERKEQKIDVKIHSIWV